MTKTRLCFIITTTVIAVLSVTLLHFYGQKQSQRWLNQHPLPTQVNSTSRTDFNYLSKLIEQQQALSTCHLRAYHWLGVQSLAKRNKALDLRIQEIEQKRLSPRLKTWWQQALKQPTQNALALYQQLKITGMLNNQQPWQSKVVSAWFIKRAKQQYQAGKTHWPLVLQHFFAKPKYWAVDPRILKHNQAVFRKTPLADQALALLLNSYPSTLITVAHYLPPHPWFNLKEIMIPSVYTPKLYQRITKLNIATLDQQALAGDRITGIHPIKRTEKQLYRLRQQVKKIYQQRYQWHWQAILSQLKLPTIENLDHWQQITQTLTNDQSSLWPLLQALNQQAYIEAPQHSPLGFFLKRNRGYAGFQAALFALNNEYQTLKQQKDSNFAAFQLSLHHLQNRTSNDTLDLAYKVAALLPSPFKQWLNQINQTLWQFELEKTAHYINQQWQEQLWPRYQKYVAERYPLNPTSQHSLSLENFSQYYQTNGLLNQFFKHYLASFVQVEKNGATFITWHNQQLPLSAQTLNGFMYAKLISRSYFDHQKPGITFTLTPEHLDRHSHHVVLNLAGQMWTITADNNLAQTLKWPGPTPEFTTLRFLTTRGKTPTVSTTGPWSWLKLVALSSQTKSTRHLHLSLKQHYVDFKFSSDLPFNPFDETLFKQSRLPATLLK